MFSPPLCEDTIPARDVFAEFPRSTTRTGETGSVTDPGKGIEILPQRGAVADETGIATAQTPAPMLHDPGNLPPMPPEYEVDHIVEEKTRLVRRKLLSGLPPADERRLAFVLWQLDRIEMARAKPDLDRLERIVEAHERLASDVSGWLTQSRAFVEESQVQPKGPRGRRKKGR